MYKRFLNDNDYTGIITNTALSQLTRDNEDRISMAEETAESSIIEYLTDNYEIEKTLAVGKNLMEYNPSITYPAGSHFYHDGKIYKALRPINGLKRPSTKVYWEEMTDFNPEKCGKAKPYSQAVDWNPGDIVVYVNTYYECKEYNGIDFNDIRIPGVIAWEKQTTYEWEANTEYNEWEAVKYNGKFYALINKDGIDQTVNPDESDNWGLIGGYDETHTYELDAHDYAEFEGELFLPVLNPNADEIKDGYNIHEDDPRNANVKKHMVRLALYELHKLISPNNISQSRITDYETSIAWLRDANKMRINPQIPRKHDDENKPVAEYALASYMRDYDPYKNIWQV